MVAAEVLRIFTGKKASPNKPPALSESMNIGIRVVGTSNQLIITVLILKLNYKRT